MSSEVELDELKELCGQLTFERDRLQKRVKVLETRDTKWADAANGYLCGAGLLEELRRPWREWQSEKMKEQ